ncbi:MAG: ABC transporter substrate-binding protein [Actinomycetota bacterium]|nr:ABC transporter substrate-binding protein [Actinomycetota bacterium]
MLIIFTLLVASAGCGEVEKETSVRVGYVENDLSQLAFFTAKEEGFFDKRRVKVSEPRGFGAGTSLMGEFSAGNLDIGYVNSGAAIIFSGREMAEINVLAQVTLENSSLVVSERIKPGDAGTLKRRIIGIPGRGTEQDFLLHRIAKKAGFSVEDVQVKVIEPERMLGALSSGGVDGIVAAEPIPAKAILQGAGFEFLSLEETPKHPGFLLVCRKQFAREHPSLMRRFVLAHADACDFIEKNSSQSEGLACRIMEEEEKVMRKALERVEFSYEPETGCLMDYVGFLKDSGIIDVEPERLLEDIIDENFLPRKVS